MLANRPPMGWNSWNTFGENINEQLIMETADCMVEKGDTDRDSVRARIIVHNESVRRSERS